MKVFRMFFRSSNLLFLLMIVFMASVTYGQIKTEEDRSWNKPVKPFKIIGNIYYVGASSVTSYLITSDKGHILIDAGFAETAPQVKQNIEALGFHLKDVKILLNSQAHYDHAGGLATLKKWTNAILLATEPDAKYLEIGGKGDLFGDDGLFDPVKVDKIIKDKEIIILGNTKITAYMTPGHSRGCTTWVMKVNEGGRTYNVVIIGGTSVPGFKLVNNIEYPGIIEDYKKTFQILKSLDCDIFLSVHSEIFSRKEKALELENGKTPNPFIDREGYKQYIEKTEKAFNDQISRELKNSN